MSLKIAMSVRIVVFAINYPPQSEPPFQISFNAGGLFIIWHSALPKLARKKPWTQLQISEHLNGNIYKKRTESHKTPSQGIIQR
jgi:hypothetical protein